MASLNSLPKILKNRSKRIGRGQGSGKSKTAGRGTKGQNARNSLSITHSHYEGGQRPLMKRLPYRRGKGNRKFSKKPMVINIGALAEGTDKIVTLESMVKARLMKNRDFKKRPVKILGFGRIEKSLEIKLPMSKKLQKSFSKTKPASK